MKKVNRQDVVNVHGNGSDTPLGRGRYKLFPMDMAVGEGFRIGDMVMRDGVIGFLSNLDPGEERAYKPFVFTTLDPKTLPKGQYSHGGFCKLSELTLLEEEVVDNQEIADLFGIPVEDLP